MPGLRTILVPFNNTQPTAAAIDAARLISEGSGAYIEGALLPSGTPDYCWRRHYPARRLSGRVRGRR